MDPFSGWITKKERKDISDVILLTRASPWIGPSILYFSARLDKQTFSLKGHMGPIGKTLGKGIVVLDFSESVLGQIDVCF